MIESIVEIENVLQIVIIDEEIGNRSIFTIPGSDDLCHKYYIYEIELDELSNKLDDEGIIIENHPDFTKMIKKIKSHTSACKNPIHDVEYEDAMYQPISLNISEKSSLFTLNLKVKTLLPPSDVMELKSKNVFELQINELIAFIVEFLSGTGNFDAIIEDEFGISVPNYTEKEKSKNQSIFIEVAGDVEDLVYDKLGENSKEYLQIREALETEE